MAWVVGSPVQESFYLGPTGQTFTRTASYVNGVSTVFAPTFTEIGGGFYRYTYTPAVAGAYEWIGTGSNGSPIALNFSVETAAQADPAAALRSVTLGNG